MRLAARRSSQLSTFLTMATAPPKTIRALQIIGKGSGTNSLKLTEISTPKPKPGEILLKIRASPILPSDVLNTKGSFPSTTFPRVPGRDFAGTVVSGPDNLVGKCTSVLFPLSCFSSS